MKYKLLSVRGKHATNIGDYVQALASAQFLPSIDGFVNREELADYNDEECCIIMNGWFMHDPSKWPPSSKIHPLFLAFHLNTSIAEKLITPAGLEYFKKYEPIGCRDTNTVEILKHHGIDAFFSGCMTLTLGNIYYDDNKSDKIYFVDPIIPKSINVLEIIKNAVYYLINIADIRTTASKLYNGHRITFKRLLLTAGFVRLYSKCFEKTIIINAEYISQENALYKNTFHTDEEKLKEAERLIRLYSKARLVVTKRIHCALPCLSLHTPVVFLTDAKDKEISTCRFGGLIDFFNVLECTSRNLVPKFDLQRSISNDYIPSNSDGWEYYAKKLTDICNNFIKSFK